MKAFLGASFIIYLQILICNAVVIGESEEPYCTV